ncbi:hypothetical protein NIES30_25235 [Phormidium tenue NIES-30]|uniref:Uncharacterized protein n=1 Tax=Phormidium tenue NIES-30 TaxID=549789 RepID=A0A1U7IY42_9CYAN|nr:hypothetical protein NIES30_25235 [Phormidium tenue NIES-30]
MELVKRGNVPSTIGYCCVSSRGQSDNTAASDQQKVRVKEAGAEESLVDVESGRSGREDGINGSKRMLRFNPNHTPLVLRPLNFYRHFQAFSPDFSGAKGIWTIAKHQIDTGQVPQRFGVAPLTFLPTRVYTSPSNRPVPYCAERLVVKPAIEEVSQLLKYEEIYLTLGRIGVSA